MGLIPQSYTPVLFLKENRRLEKLRNAPELYPNWDSRFWAILIPLLCFFQLYVLILHPIHESVMQDILFEF